MGDRERIGENQKMGSWRKNAQSTKVKEVSDREKYSEKEGERQGVSVVNEFHPQADYPSYVNN